MKMLKNMFATLIVATIASTSALFGADNTNVIGIDISSSDGGKTLNGTMTYSTEGPIGFKGTLRADNGGDNVAVQNQWGGPTAPWNPGGRWVIGTRDKQHVVGLKVSSSDNGKSLNGTMTYAGEGPIGFRSAREANGVVYDVDNQWDGPSAPWHDGGAWVLGTRGDKKQYLLAIDISSKDNGKTFGGTVTYEGEGPIGFKATQVAGDGNGYKVENQWGGPSAPWHPAGNWLIGGRNQRCVKVSAKSADGGKSLSGTMTYAGEGPIGFKGKMVKGDAYTVENQWGGPSASWQPGGVYVLGDR